jgi:hypothetical protein
MRTDNVLLASASTSRIAMAMLFSGADIKVVFNNIEGNVATEISNCGDDYVLAHSIDDLVQHLLDKYAARTLPRKTN